MKFLKYGKDGGKDSTVTGFWLIEIKSLFSIVLLKFEIGSREDYHNHAFHALSWFISGEVDEMHLDGRILNWRPSIVPKLTLRSCFHRVYAKRPTYCFSIRGPWTKTWQEYFPSTATFQTLTNGRRIVHD